MTTELGVHTGNWIPMRAIRKMGFRVAESDDGVLKFRDMDATEYLWEGTRLERNGRLFELFLYNPKKREFFVERVDDDEYPS